jgi:phage shock protein E
VGEEANAMSVDEAREAIASRDGVVLVVDVRSVDEFGEGHVPGAVNAEDGDAEAVKSALDEGRDADSVLVVCGDGERSRELAAELAAGELEAAYLDGGMKAWSKKHAVEPPPAEAEFEGPKKKTLY